MPPEPTSPVGVGTAATCPVCQTVFVRRSPRHPAQRYCSQPCRRTAWERRQRTQHAQDPPRRHRPSHPPAAVRDCPHCGQPIVIVALLTTPEAANPRPPQPEVIAIRSR